ncbi:MAG: sigma-70 family RNA polymerase sigma factor [Longispora sp.]|nr:sigma-70 family RNA polymerase sigma factor [Longispora sp. (in: high G+C Gram-positive bacteria)]
MNHTDAEIEQAALRFEQLADALDPATAQVEQIEDLRQIGTVAQDIQTQEARLREAVNLARVHGRSWNQIAVALGVSRQAARQRFTNAGHT